MGRARIILVVVLLGGAARAQSIEVSGDGEGLPFSIAELVAAVEARVTTATARVALEPAPEGLVVRLGARERRVALGAETGPAAARRVALAIGDLLLEAPAAGLPPVVPPARRRDGWRVGLWPSVALSLGADHDPAAALAVDVDAPLSRRWHLAAQLAAASSTAYRAFTVRPAVGLQLGPLALRVGPVASHIDLRWAGAGFVAGGHAAALLAVPIAGGLRGVLEVGGELYANRVEGIAYVQPQGYEPPFPVAVGVTPRAVLRGGAGLAWQW